MNKSFSFIKDPDHLHLESNTTSPSMTTKTISSETDSRSSKEAPVNSNKKQKRAHVSSKSTVVESQTQLSPRQQSSESIAKTPDLTREHAAVDTPATSEQTHAKKGSNRGKKRKIVAEEEGARTDVVETATPKQTTRSGTISRTTTPSVANDDNNIMMDHLKKVFKFDKNDKKESAEKILDTFAKLNMEKCTSRMKLAKLEVETEATEERLDNNLMDQVKLSIEYVEKAKNKKLALQSIADNECLSILQDMDFGRE